MKNPTSVQRMAPEFADLSEDQHVRSSVCFKYEISSTTCTNPVGVLKVFPEGFVIRVCRGFAVNEFETAMGKYVREGHLQTKDDFRRNWTPSIDRPYKGTHLEYQRWCHPRSMNQLSNVLLSRDHIVR